MAHHRTRGDRLRHLADEMLTLADAVDVPSCSHGRGDLLCAEGERISAETRAVFRGRADEGLALFRRQG